MSQLAQVGCRRQCYACNEHRSRAQYNTSPELQSATNVDDIMLREYANLTADLQYGQLVLVLQFFKRMQ